MIERRVSMGGVGTPSVGMCTCQRGWCQHLRSPPAPPFLLEGGLVSLNCTALIGNPNTAACVGKRPRFAMGSGFRALQVGLLLSIPSAVLRTSSTAISSVISFHGAVPGWSGGKANSQLRRAIVRTLAPSGPPHPVIGGARKNAERRNAALRRCGVVPVSLPTYSDAFDNSEEDFDSAPVRSSCGRGPPAVSCDRTAAHRSLPMTTIPRTCVFRRALRRRVTKLVDRPFWDVAFPVHRGH